MAETDFKYDVFISYTSANKEWVRKVFVPTLEKAGLKCCDYYRDFDPGAPIVKEMENAVLKSRKTILVLSPAYLQRAWTEFENLMLQTLDPANQERRLLPVIIEKCDLPLRIKYMNCINFANPDEVEIEWERLSRALGTTLSPSALDPKKTDTASRDTWHLAHPYPMPPNFTGRAAEQKMLDDWLANNKDRLFILRALGGFGKSALSWQWINTHVNPTEWIKLVFWSFYEGDASFEHFIEETLKYLKLEVPQGQRPQVDELLKAMQGGRILLIMDGFERALRAYSSMNAAYQGDEEESPSPTSGRGDRGEGGLDCVNINAEIFLKSICSLPNIKSKVLMTTRLTPRAVKPRGEFMLGCREEELTALQPADAVEFFRKQKIKGTHAEIEAACAPYGYHPLSLRLLAGRILKDFDNPADIIVAQKLKIDGDIIQQKHHVLEVSYNSLLQHEQKLLSTIACFRSLVELKTLEAIAKDVGATHESPLQDDLHDLVERGLLHFDDRNKKFDLHPIVRRYAYERLAAPDRTAAHNRLRDYFAAIDVPRQPQTIEDLAPVIELYHHMVRAEKFTEAEMLYHDRLRYILYYQLGAYQIIIDLLRSLFIHGENELPPLDTDDKKGFVLNELANAFSMIGQSRRAVPLFEGYISISKKRNDGKNLVIGLGNLTQRHLALGAFKDVERNIIQQIQGCKRNDDKFWEANGHEHWGVLYSLMGDWESMEQEFIKAITLFEEVGGEMAFSTVWARRSEGNLKAKNVVLAFENVQKSLKFADSWAKTQFQMPRDYVRAYWLLGTAYRLNNQLDLAEHNLNEALSQCRAINHVEHEADIILDLARLRYDQRNYEEAKSLAEEALLITERCGYVLQGADVNLFLATLALEGYTLERFRFEGAKELSNKEIAILHAKEALKLATCDGPPYYYKVAYEEAERMLKALG